MDKRVQVEWQFNPGSDSYEWLFGEITAAELAVLQHSAHITMRGKVWSIGSGMIQNWSENGLVRVVIPLYSGII